MRDIRIPLKLRVVNEGIAHHEDSWIFSNQHILYRTTIDPIVVETSNYDGIPEELRALKYDHIGDIDVLDGVIYGGVENKDSNMNAVLATWNASDLQMIRYKVTTETYHMPWVAVDSSTRLIYSAQWNGDELMVYDATSFDFIRSIPVTPSLPKEIQGGAFYDSDLYICVNGG